MNRREFSGFQAQSLDHKNRRDQKIFSLLFGWMTLLLALPVIVILTLLIAKGAPVFTKNRVQISVEYPGASPVKMERQVIRSMEEVLGEVEGVERFVSDYGQGWALLTLVASPGADLELLLGGVTARVATDGTSAGGPGSTWPLPAGCVLPVVKSVSLWGRVVNFFTKNPTNGMTEGGIFPALIGTLWIVFVALLASLPLGVAAAVYLSEYAPDNGLTRLINLAIINLAGVPSIVHALFGVGAFVLFFGMGTSILAAGLTLAVMTLPVVIVSTRESLQAVPQAFREACWSMGATRWQTIRKVVLPNSISGILTGMILEVSRTVGETAPIMFTGAAFFLPFLPRGVLDQTMAMSLHLFVVSTQVPNVPQELPFGVALVLIGLVLALNSVSIAFRMYLRGAKKW